MAMRGRLNLAATTTRGVAIPGQSLISVNALLFMFVLFSLLCEHDKVIIAVCQLSCETDPMLANRRAVDVVMFVLKTDSSTAQNPVPLLPTDGGNFVALQKKSLDEEFSDPHHVRILLHV